MPSAMDRQTREHYGAIGKVAVEWTRFESYLAETVRMLAGVDNNYGKCITAQIFSVDRFLDALSALVDLRSPGAADEEQFKKRLERIQSIAERRDQVVHDVWTFDPGTTTRCGPLTIRVHSDADGGFALNRITSKVVFTGILVGCCAGVAQVPTGAHQAEFPPVQQFHPERNTSNSLQDKLGFAEAVITPDHIYVRAKYESSKVETELPAEVGQVNRLFRDVQARIVVSAMVNGSSSEVLIIDRSGRIADRFLCYLPSVSPDGHYVAYIKFYPSHFAEGTTDKYMLYNLGKTPSENRNPITSLSEWISVGRTVFPPGTDNLPGDNTNQQEFDTHACASELFWSPDSRRIAFLERESIGYELVQASLESDGRVSTSELPVSTSAICNSANGTDLDSSQCHLLMRSVGFGVDGSPVTAEVQVVPNHSVTLTLHGSRFTALQAGPPT